MANALRSLTALGRRFIRSDRGATAIEYGLIAALIAVVIITGLNNISGALNTKFSTIATKLL